MDSCVQKHVGHSKYNSSNTLACALKPRRLATNVSMSHGRADAIWPHERGHARADSSMS